jgi:hypothetical protein
MECGENSPCCGGLNSISGLSVWDLWYTEWPWDRFYSEYFVVPCYYSASASYHSFFYNLCYVVLEVESVIKEHAHKKERGLTVGLRPEVTSLTPV